MDELNARDLVGDEWADWFSLSPAERWKQTEQLWTTFLSLGGSLDSEPDPRSPFFDEEERRANLADGRTSLRIIRSCGI